jgi:hypothetical protein
METLAIALIAAGVVFAVALLWGFWRAMRDE